MKKWIAVAAIVILVIGGIVIYRVTSKPKTKVLETARVTRGNIRGVIVETGIIKPQVGAVIKIGARATGTITKMNVKIGDRVRKGQLIALIDDREILKALEQQRAALVSAQQTALQIEQTYPERIREATARYEYARLSFDREKELARHDYTTKDAVDRAQSELDASEALVARLRKEFGTQTKIAQATVDDISAQIKQLETRLTYTRIYSPIDGVVSDVTAQEGETIVAGLQVANLVTVLDPTLLEMWIYVDETDIGRVRNGQEVEYSVDTFPDKVFTGRIGKIYPQPVVKENIVYYLAIVTVSRDDSMFLKPEMTTHCKIVFSEKTDILIAPNAAIKFEHGKQVAYKVVGHETVQPVAVTTGIRGEDNTEIISGIAEGDTVATKLVLPVSSKPSSP